MISTEQPLLRVSQLSKRYGALNALSDASFELWPGEVMAVVGESGSGKSTLLNTIAALNQPDAGQVEFLCRDGQMQNVHVLSQAQQRHIARTDWGFVHQNSEQGLRMDVSAGANVGERLMGLGERNYAHIRSMAQHWLQRVEIDLSRIDDTPRVFSGGMRQRLQIARNLVTNPRLVFMDEPTSGLDVSVQAKLLDLLRQLTSQMRLAVVIVTHDLAVARLLSHRMMVMQQGHIVETGLTDQLLDDPQHPYTQLLVSSVLQP
jgi:putative phosphonate transport system ATP-binding protein